MRLPKDSARCHDDSCRDRYTCARFLERFTASPAAPTSDCLCGMETRSRYLESDHAIIRREKLRRMGYDTEQLEEPQ
jgi:hypothetical protein